MPHQPATGRSHHRDSIESKSRGPDSKKVPPADSLATIDDVAAYLRIPRHTLYRWRQHGDGPHAVRLGRWLRYDWRDVEKWLHERKAAS